MIDVIQQIDAIHREVSDREVAAGTARSIRISRDYDAPVEDVWDALTNPQRIGRWFLPITGNIRLGGTFQFEGNAGGEILECRRPERLKVTWVYGPPAPDAFSEVEIRLSPLGAEATRLEFDHTATVPDEMWNEYGPGAVGVGWDGGFLGLALHLQGGSVGDAEAWQLSDEGREYSRRSSAAWGEASRAAGVDDETVARQVASTTAFYTGEPVAPS
jgi:uncharacterized protein YndB with AHSA1/START domain